MLYNKILDDIRLRQNAAMISLLNTQDLKRDLDTLSLRLGKTQDYL